MLFAKNKQGTTICSDLKQIINNKTTLKQLIIIAKEDLLSVCYNKTQYIII
jgi:hypothetical protein